MRLNTSLLLIALFSLAFIKVDAGVGVTISSYYMFFSTNFTNNGGIDNSTCDLKMDGIYSTSLTGDNVAAFFVIQTDPGYLYYNDYFDDGDLGIACKVSYISTSTSWKCYYVSIAAD